MKKPPRGGRGYLPVRPALFSLLFLLTGALPAHDFHASLAEVTYNPATRAFEVSMRVFTDDFTDALRAAYPTAAFGDVEQAGGVAYAYLQPRFQLIDRAGKPLPMHFVGIEGGVDATWLYFSFSCPDADRLGQLRNVVLTELFDDQSNLVNVRVAGRQRSYVLRRTSPAARLDE